MRPVFLAIVGPSGVGKGTLLKKLFADYPNTFALSISHTSRPMRMGEVNGVHYHFRPKEDILRDAAAGEYLEHAEVHGNIYGTAKSELQRIKDLKKVCVLEIDLQGMESVKQSMGDQGKYIFIRAPSMDVLRKRLEGRGTETEKSLALRLNNAIGELEKAQHLEFDLTIVNDEVERAYAELRNFCDQWIVPNPMDKY